jgi:hypothetical protein
MIPRYAQRFLSLPFTYVRSAIYQLPTEGNVRSGQYGLRLKGGVILHPSSFILLDAAL